MAGERLVGAQRRASNLGGEEECGKVATTSNTLDSTRANKPATFDYDSRCFWQSARLICQITIWGHLRQIYRQLRFEQSGPTIVDNRLDGAECGSGQILTSANH